jgi:hypothetical protein
MAAKKEGVSVNRVQACCTRGQLLSCGPAILCSSRNECGQLVEEYQFEKERGSAVRALMHGALDVCTGGLWEVVGTPIEACGNQREYFAIRVFYNPDDTINRVELL